jgi:hypothetical protein
MQRRLMIKAAPLLWELSAAIVSRQDAAPTEKMAGLARAKGENP